MAEGYYRLREENTKMREAILAAITEARSLDANTDRLVDEILMPALKPEPMKYSTKPLPKPRQARKCRRQGWAMVPGQGWKWITRKS